MSRSQESFNKKETRKKKEQKRKEKEKKRQERKENAGKPDFDDMIAYVDEFGNITDTPPDPEEKEEIDAEDIVLSNKKDESDAGGVKTGVITFYNDDKGFGFIRDSDTKQDIFLHVSNTLEPVGENDKVVYEIGKGDKGPVAINVKINK